MVTYESILQNEAVNTYIRKADEMLTALGYTEHSFAHVGLVARMGRYLLESLGHPERDLRLVQIASHLHDIGNLVNRFEHCQSSAVMAFQILTDLGMPADEVADVVAAIGNHDESSGYPVSDIAAALILADKSDVRRSRVRNRDMSAFDIHDRVNYSVEKTELIVDPDKTKVLLRLTIDTRYGSVMEYFEIFLQRMILCRKAAEKLGLQFRLMINEHPLI